MAKVIGIGGVFLRSADAVALREWYARVLGVEVKSWGGAIFAALPGGQTVWSAFAEDSAKFAPSNREVMLNFVVDDLEGLLARAVAEGVAVMGKEEDAYGRFASVLDPDGRKIELWEPTTAD